MDQRPYDEVPMNRARGRSGSNNGFTAKIIGRWADGSALRANPSRVAQRAQSRAISRFWCAGYVGWAGHRALKAAQGQRTQARRRLLGRAAPLSLRSRGREVVQGRLGWMDLRDG